MKNYEKLLLKRMHYEQAGSNNQPLENVKNALGSIAFAKGNPLTKTEIALQVSLNYFCNQQPIGLAALPANLQNSFPLYLFGLTDFYSGYNKALNVLPLNANWNTLDRFSYNLGEELIDQNLGTGFLQPAYWDVIGGNWLPNPVLGYIEVNPAGALASIVKNNFWIPGRVYRIKLQIQDTGVVNLGMIDLPYDGIAMNNFYTEENNGIFEYDYVPQLPNLAMRAQLTPATPTVITSLSVKEITGYDYYTSEPSIGVFGFNKHNVLSPNIERGDVVISYIAPVLNFRLNFNNTRLFYYDYYTAEIVIHCNNVSYGTFLNSFVSDLITINTIRYSVPIANVAQFINPLVFGYQTLFGKTFTDTIDPRNYITSRDFQQQIADVPINLPIDKAVMLCTNIDANCQNLTMLLFVEKVEPLTHK